MLKRLSEAGLRLNKEKCVFFLEQMEYLGHTTDAQGVHPTGEKIKAIKNAPQLKNVTELRSFLESSIITAVSCPPYQQKWHPYTVYCERRPGGLGVVNCRRHSL